MQRSKLLDYLSKLEKSKLKKFQLFVQSPYFNSNKNAIALIDFICTIKDWSSPQLSKEKVHKKLFPKATTYNETTINVLMSHLSKLFYQFLGQEQYENEPNLHATFAAMNGFWVNYPKLDEDLQKRALKDLEQQEQNEFKHLAAYYLHRLIQWTLWRNYQKIKKEHYATASEQLDIFYGLLKSEIDSSIASTFAFVGEKWGIDPFISNDLYKHLLKKYPENKLLYGHIGATHLSLNPYDFDFYEQFKENIIEHLSTFSIQSIDQILNATTNFCIRNAVETGDTSIAYYRELFMWQQFYIDFELIKKTGIIGRDTFYNMFKVGLRLKEFEWAENFLQEHKDFLPEEAKESTSALCLARLHFEKKEFDLAQQVFITAKINRGHAYSEKQAILAMIYYEQEEWTLLESLLETLRIYITRDKSSTDFSRQSKLDFSRLFKHLLVLKDKPLNAKEQQQEKEALIQSISNSKAYSKEWLLEKTINLN